MAHHLRAHLEICVRRTGSVPPAVSRLALLLGLPACPDLEEQVKIDALLDFSSIGVHLSDEFQLDPEQRTSAIVVPYPEAKYLVV